MRRNTPNFTYEQDLACPECGGMMRKMYFEDRHGIRRRHSYTLERPEKDGPWADDDVLVPVTEAQGRYRHNVTGRVWKHTIALMCSKCGKGGSYGNAVHHEFSDDELPFDFWQAPEGKYETPEAPLPDVPGASEAPELFPDLKSLF